MISYRAYTRINASLAIMYARLPLQEGAGNCKKAYLHNHNSVDILMNRKITRALEVNVIDPSVVYETSVQS